MALGTHSLHKTVASSGTPDLPENKPLRLPPACVACLLHVKLHSAAGKGLLAPQGTAAHQPVQLPAIDVLTRPRTLRDGLPLLCR